VNPVASEVRVYFGPLLVDGFELVVLELYAPTIKLARTEVKMDVRMGGIAMDSAERDRLRKRLLKKVVRQVSDLFVSSRDIK
jgi:hypothetical protein